MTELSLRDSPRQMQLVAERNENGQYKAAMDRAGRWLALRARTTSELRTRLIEGGFDEDVVERVLVRLAELSLIDDAAFARQWIEEATRRKGLGTEALIAQLAAKGIERVTAEAALAELGLDELSRATDLATKWMGRVGDLPLPEQAARISRMLARKGYAEETVAAATRAVLPPEGWD